MQHPRHTHVDAELGRAVDLGRGVLAREPLAGEPQFAGRLEAGRCRHRQPRSLGDEFAVAERASARFVQHAAVEGTAAGSFDAPALGRRRDEHLARRGADPTQHVAVGHDRVTAADALPLVHGTVEGRIGVRLQHDDLRPVGVEFIRDDARQRIEDTLADLGLRADDAHLARRRHRQVGREGVDRRGARRRCGRRGRFGGLRHRHGMGGQREARSGCDDRQQELAASGAFGRVVRNG